MSRHIKPSAIATSCGGCSCGGSGNQPHRTATHSRLPRLHTAATYAKVMGGIPPSQPGIKPEYTLSCCPWLEVAGCISPPYRLYQSRRYAAAQPGYPLTPISCSSSRWSRCRCGEGSRVDLSTSQSPAPLEISRPINSISPRGSEEEHRHHRRMRTTSETVAVAVGWQRYALPHLEVKRRGPLVAPLQTHAPLAPQIA